MRLTKYALLFIFAIASLIACNDNPDIIDFDTSKGISEEDFTELTKHVNLPRRSHNYFVKTPQHLTSFGTGSSFVDNKFATIGRVLFYDTRLSVNGQISCASCHDQKKAFADGLTFSEGVNNLVTDRNSLALAAAPSFDSYDDGGERDPTGGSSSLIFGWDNSKANLFEVMETALTKSNEMGNQSLQEIADRIDQDPVYQILMKDLNGIERLDQDFMMVALESFINSITAFDTKFDRAFTNDPSLSSFDDFSSFTRSENQGKVLYLNNCANCHSERHDFLFQPTANNGLDLKYEDIGVGAFVGSDLDGHFKIPFLRNVALTAPYMHDGRFETLKEVIEHYSNGIQNHKNLSISLKDRDDAVQMNFTESEKASLIAYLNTLTDQTVVNDEKYSDPWIR